MRFGLRSGPFAPVSSLAQRALASTFWLSQTSTRQLGPCRLRGMRAASVSSASATSLRTSRTAPTKSNATTSVDSMLKETATLSAPPSVGRRGGQGSPTRLGPHRLRGIRGACQKPQRLCHSLSYSQKLVSCASWDDDAPPPEGFFVRRGPKMSPRDEHAPPDRSQWVLQSPTLGCIHLFTSLRYQRARLLSQAPPSLRRTPLFRFASVGLSR